MPEVDILQLENQVVVAPAGCGKTHQIVGALDRHDDGLPVLVLTHTNAGVAALRQKLNTTGVSTRRYRLATIDGWALRVVASFPVRSGYTGGFRPVRPDYVAIRRACWALLKSGHISDIIRANYSRIIVDEYQDCSVHQHGIVLWASKTIPICALGDPMQAIFGFGDDGLPDWNDEVCRHFPLGGELCTPWRWRNVGNEELGQWLLDVRGLLLERSAVDLGDRPDSVRIVELQGDAQDHDRLVAAAVCEHREDGDKTLVIGDSRSAESRYRIAKRVPGMITVEPVDLRDLIRFARRVNCTNESCIRDTLEFAASVITNVAPAQVLRRIDSLAAGRARRGPSELEQLALEVKAQPSISGVASLLSACSKQPGSRTYRPAVLRACLRALQLSISTQGLTISDAAVRIREENRAFGRQIPRHAIGSTLLLKGLEADHVVVLNADDLDPENLYVAMTRGAKSVTLCTKVQHLHPERNRE